MMTIIHGDCIEVMATMDAASVDAIVTDPPYELGFMGKKWDGTGIAFDPATWESCLRVLKPGGYLLAFGGSRTFHRIAVAIEDAGFRLQDTLSWLHGQGFPKGKAQLKPAWEPIIMARKTGSAVLQIDACRIEYLGDADRGDPNRFIGADGQGRTVMDAAKRSGPLLGRVLPATSGRWPANVLLDEDAAEAAGEWSRYFYTAKSSRSERNAGLDGMPERDARAVYNQNCQQCESCGRKYPNSVHHCVCGGILSVVEVANPPRANHHPTVKPLSLMRWLVRLVTPPGGVVLDPFTGSGTTGCAAALEGFGFIGIEQDSDYVAIARKRIAHWTPTPEPQLALDLGATTQ